MTDGVRFRFFIDQSEDKLHGKTLHFMLSSWDFMLQCNEESLKSFKLSYMIKLMHFSRATKVDFYGKDNMIRVL